MLPLEVNIGDILILATVYLTIIITFQWKHLWLLESVIVFLIKLVILIKLFIKRLMLDLGYKLELHLLW